MDTNKTKVSELLGVSMEKIRDMADVNSIIGEPIKIDDLTTVIPVSKVSYGFASGGSDFPSKSDKSLFGGAAGAGVSIKPEGFLVISNGSAKMIPMNSDGGPIGAVMNSVPEVVDKIADFIKKKKDGNSSGDPVDIPVE